MKTSIRIRTIVSIILFMVVLGISGTASAGQWMYSHGNVSQIETPANCSYKYFGWGLDLTQNSGLYNWIHMTVPTPHDGKLGAQIIKLRFYTGSADAMISEVDVYNGNNKLATFKSLSYTSGTWAELQLDMGSKKMFTRGMGISIKIGAGVESMSHRFIFSAAGAYFY